MVVHRRHPKSLGGGYFRFLILLFLTSAFENEVQQVGWAVPVVNAYDEIWKVVVLLAV